MNIFGKLENTTKSETNTNMLDGSYTIDNNRSNVFHSNFSQKNTPDLILFYSNHGAKHLKKREKTGTAKANQTCKGNPTTLQRRI